mmetsp:Transcript_30703/g.69894  ORF Transcript_30703/g.69894 Transcript_30703/m.69894 type:complete len:242 (-) Transcript_30703:37-762(-)
MSLGSMSSCCTRQPVELGTCMPAMTGSVGDRVADSRPTMTQCPHVDTKTLFPARTTAPYLGQSTSPVRLDTTCCKASGDRMPCCACRTCGARLEQNQEAAPGFPPDPSEMQHHGSARSATNVTVCSMPPWTEAPTERAGSTKEDSTLVARGLSICKPWGPELTLRSCRKAETDGAQTNRPLRGTRDLLPHWARIAVLSARGIAESRSPKTSSAGSGSAFPGRRTSPPHRTPRPQFPGSQLW